MRRLSRAQEQMLAEYDRDMAAIKRDREKGKHPILSKGAHAPLLPPSWRPRPSARPTRMVGYRSGEPWQVCRICHEPTHPVARTGMCVRCAAEVAWRVSVARSGLRVVS